MRKRYLLAALFVVIGATAQAAEIQDFVYLVAPSTPGQSDAVQVVWIPAPVLKQCVGQTLQRCIDLDYSNRTKGPAYSKQTAPRRVMSIVYFRAAGFPKLFQFYDAKPRTAFTLLSESNRLRARIKLTRKPDDDDFEVLEFL